MHLNDRRCPSQVYSELVASWIARNFTLRYTGGMVPDVHHILAKGGGVFCNPVSAATPAKLRLVYECAPLAFIIEVGCRFNVLFSGVLVPYSSRVLQCILGCLYALMPSVALRDDLQAANLRCTQAAGGMSHDGKGSMLDQVITSTATRSIVCLGSRELVEESIPAMQASSG